MIIHHACPHDFATPWIFIHFQEDPHLGASHLLVDPKMGLCDTEPLQPLPMISPWIFSASCEGPRFSKARIVGGESLEASDSLGPKDSAMGLSMTSPGLNGGTALQQYPEMSN